MGSLARRVLAVTAVAGLVLAGCGKNGSGGGSTGIPKVSASSYVAKICSGMNTWQRAIQTRVSKLNRSLSPTDTVEQRKNALADYLDGLVADTDGLVQSAKKAGVPDVSGGEQAPQRIDTAFQQVRSALEDARKRVDTMPTDVTAFQNATKQLGNDISDSISKIGNSLGSLTQGDLDAAFSANPNCQQISTVGA